MNRVWLEEIQWTHHQGGGGGFQDSFTTDSNARGVSIVINAVEDTAVHLIREHEKAGFMLNQELTTWLFSISYLHFKYAKVHRIWFVTGYNVSITTAG